MLFCTKLTIRASLHIAASSTGAAPSARRCGMPRAPIRIAELPTVAHAVYRLAPDLLLVFKPRGHREATHAHPHRQRLRILRGRLRVDSARGAVELAPADRVYLLAAGRAHSTVALADTWLIAESVAVAPARRRASAERRARGAPSARR
jgi:hypothetical protein